MSQSPAVPRKTFPSISAILFSFHQEPESIVLCSSPSPRRQGQSYQPADFMRVMAPRLTNSNSVSSLSLTATLRHRRSSSYGSSDSRDYFADASDIETIAEGEDEEEDDVCPSARIERSSETDLEYSPYLDFFSPEEVQEDWWGDVEDEFDGEDYEGTLSYSGWDTDSDSTIVEVPTPPKSRMLSFSQRLILRVSGHWKGSKTAVENGIYNDPSASKASLIQPKKFSPRPNILRFWRFP